MFEKNMSLADKIFITLENDILSGKYEYGEMLTEMRLSEELGVSRTPIREALARLTDENILIDKGKGLMVRGITREDIEDIMEIRIRIEGIAARYAALRMDEDEKKALSEALDLQEYYISKCDSDKIQYQDHSFHEIIYKGCKSLSLDSVLSPLHRITAKYRRNSVRDKVRAEKSLSEHRAIAEAIIRGDSDAAEKAMSEHISLASHSILGEKK